MFGYQFDWEVSERRRGACRRPAINPLASAMGREPTAAYGYKADVSPMEF